MSTATTSYHYVTFAGRRLSHREAARDDAPAMALPQGFLTSSYLTEGRLEPARPYPLRDLRPGLRRAHSLATGAEPAPRDHRDHHTEPAGL